MPAYSFDAVRNGVRNAIFGEAYVTIESLSFSGEVTFHRPGETVNHHKEFAEYSVREEPLTWKAMIGIIDLYNRSEDGSDLIIEGVGIYPQLVHELSFENLAIRAAFVGFLDEGHIESVLEHAKDKKDWIHVWLQEVDGEESVVRKWLMDELRRSKNDKKLAEKYGYEFFDVSSRPFDQHIQAATRYLLKDQP